MRAELISSIVSALLLVCMLPIMTIRLPTTLAEELPYEFLYGTGTHFEAQRFGVFVTTDTDVNIWLRASSEILSFCIEKVGDATSTRLTFGTLKPSTMYYMYQDGYENEQAFLTDDAGSYAYDQDLSKLHFIIIQPTHGTVTIYQSTKLQNDIYGTVEIGASNIVLDLNGYSIIGSSGDFIGVNMFDETNVIIKNGAIVNHFCGMAITNSSNIVVDNCTIGPCGWNGIIYMAYPHHNTVANCTFTQAAIEVSSTSYCKFYHNNFDSGMHVYPPNHDNVWDTGYPGGGNYWSFYGCADQCSGPDQDLPGCDGICDLPYVIGPNDVDRYPLTSAWTRTSTGVSTLITKGQESYPIEMVSDSVISNVKPNPSKLVFTVAGETGTSGYVRAVIPVGLNSTRLKVYLNNSQVQTPPLVITTNATHYFIYFDFVFMSVYEVTFLFEPFMAAATVDPIAMNLGSHGQMITCWINLPNGYSASDIDISTIIMNGTVHAEQDITSATGSRLMVKFDRAEVIAYIAAHVDMTTLAKSKFMTITLSVTCELHDGTPFLGVATTKVILQQAGGAGGSSFS